MIGREAYKNHGYLIQIFLMKILKEKKVIFSYINFLKNNFVEYTFNKKCFTSYS